MGRGRLLRQAGLLNRPEVGANLRNVARRDTDSRTRSEIVAGLKRVICALESVCMLNSGCVKGNDRPRDDDGVSIRLARGHGSLNNCIRWSTRTDSRLAGTDGLCGGSIRLRNNCVVIRCVKTDGVGGKNKWVILVESVLDLTSTGSGIGSIEGLTLCLRVAIFDTSTDDTCRQIGNMAKQQLSRGITGLLGVVSRLIVNAPTICDMVGVQPVIINDWTSILTEGGLPLSSGSVGPLRASQTLVDASGRAQGDRLVASMTRGVEMSGDGSDGDVRRLLHAMSRAHGSRNL